MKTPVLDELTPREIVRELDKYVIGQPEAKRAVAIALRNRIRRQKLPPEMAEEVMPKNILMIGPTGVGKTELARRLAKLANSPFMKVEASKFTEVGYVGRDVESMIRDLVDIAIDMVREERLDEVGDRAEAQRGRAPARSADAAAAGERRDATSKTREKLRERLRDGKLDERMVEIEVKDRAPTFEIASQRRTSKRWASTSRTCCPPCSAQRLAEAQHARGRSARLPGAGRRAEADRHGSGDAHGARPRGIERHHLPGRDRQDRRAAKAATVPMSAAKACSATFCRSSKAPRSTRATASCARITSCSSRRARSTSRSPAI